MIDCVDFNVSSAITSCDVIDICCSDDSCWVETDSGPSTDELEVIDVICDWSAPASYLPIYIPGWFVGPVAPLL